MKRIAIGLAILACGLKVGAIILADGMSDIERDARALELYLQDRQDHKDYCPQIDWNQPPLDTYKETLRSHLPDGCKG